MLRLGRWQLAALGDQLGERAARVPITMARQARQHECALEKGGGQECLPDRAQLIPHSPCVGGEACEPSIFGTPEPSSSVLRRAARDSSRLELERRVELERQVTMRGWSGGFQRLSVTRRIEHGGFQRLSVTRRIEHRLEPQAALTKPQTNQLGALRT